MTQKATLLGAVLCVTRRRRIETACVALRAHCAKRQNGVTNFTIVRATTGASLSSTGFEWLFRVGYDFAQPSGPYLLGQLSGQVYNGGKDGTATWGPTLYAGWRF